MVNDEYCALKRKYDNINFDSSILRSEFETIMMSLKNILCDCTTDYYRANAIKNFLVALMTAENPQAVHKFFDEFDEVCEHLLDDKVAIKVVNMRSIDLPDTGDQSDVKTDEDAEIPF